MPDMLPLELSLAETKVLAAAVRMLIRLDSAALLDEVGRDMAAEEIGVEYGAVGSSRGEQTLAAARERLPVLRRLRTLLGEHTEMLQRSP
jgi:hypothetical protein